MKRHLPLVSVLAALALVACGGPLRYELHGSPKTPEADAQIVADVNEETNTSTLEIHIEHLAPPARVQEGSNNYVVWYRKGSDGGWVRVGTLKYDEGDRLGEIAGVSVPLTTFELAITVEEAEAPESPSPHIIFSQTVSD
jgi:hypothetical protein